MQRAFHGCEATDGKIAGGTMSIGGPWQHARSSNCYPDDLLNLEELDDDQLVAGLRTRYEQRQIYTWVGGVLVSLNPYQDIGSFSEELASQYAAEAAETACKSEFGTHPIAERRDQSRLPPHLFSVVAAALHADDSQQAILISGESGAGKTEATRAALSFMAWSCGTADTVRDRLLHSNPILEAFGNAQTRQNGNSSRFGKLIEVYFSAPAPGAALGQLQGATLRSYMLEASRVAGELPDAERSYHIFYHVRAVLGTLDGAWSGSVLPASPLFERICGTPAWREVARIAGRALASSPRLEAGPSLESCLASFEDLYRRMLVSGITHAQVLRCASVIAAVGILADTPAAEAASGALEALLGVPKDDLDWFLTRVETSIGTQTHRERLVRTRTERESKTLLSSLAQELYAGLFNWVTRAVMQNLAPDEAMVATTSKSRLSRRIALLDLYGFEVFASNGFEQLLINYCNERIQQLFNRQVFLREAEEYAAEGLDGDGHWTQLAAACSLPALELLEGTSRFAGVFGVINDRSRCGFDPSTSGDGSEIAQTIASTCGKHVAFRRLTRGESRQRVFGVVHFAGEVFYEAKNFVLKNASAFKPDIVSFLRRAGNAFVHELFETESGISRGFQDAGKEASPVQRRFLGTTITSAFKAEVNELCSTLEAHQCRHVRCLRPNDRQVALHFDTGPMMRQCRYSGLLEAIRIRRCGFSHRRTLSTFKERYALILRAQSPAQASIDQQHPCEDGALAPIVEAMMLQAGFGPEEVRLGRSKVFLQQAPLAWLENTRADLGKERVESALLGWVARCRFVRLRRAVLRIQALMRSVQARRLRCKAQAARAALVTFKLQTWSAFKLQTWWRHVSFERSQVSACLSSRSVHESPCRRLSVRSSRSLRGAPRIGTTRTHERSTEVIGAMPRVPLLAMPGSQVPASFIPQQRSVKDKENQAQHSARYKENQVPTGLAATASAVKLAWQQKAAAMQSPPVSPRSSVVGTPRGYLFTLRDEPLIDSAAAQGASKVSSPSSSLRRLVSTGRVSSASSTTGRVGSPSSSQTSFARRPARSPAFDRRIADRLQAQLSQVGRALRDKELPPEKAEVLQGILESVMAAPSGIFSVRDRRGSPGASPPAWKRPGRNDSCLATASPSLSSRKVMGESPRLSSPSSAAGLPTEVAARQRNLAAKASAPPCRSSSSLGPRPGSPKQCPHGGSWAAPDGFFRPRGGEASCAAPAVVVEAKPLLSSAVLDKFPGHAHEKRAAGRRAPLSDATNSLGRT
eukprot:TRINITY_DN26191_c0_g1_i1.p1 TRINITY_DN26191_c0_g1~~TRINITY_DN26191_c0_g1_i1.p1  ORF type:complete len:1265 (-),score=199.83 TRINITY_DN26191_c0_g1_i1:80-3874(-)